MKTTSGPKAKTSRVSGLRSEYSFDYSKAQPNRFASRMEEGSYAIVLDPDVARYFQTPESVNGVLRALMTALPATRPIRRPKK